MSFRKHTKLTSNITDKVQAYNTVRNEYPNTGRKGIERLFSTRLKDHLNRKRSGKTKQVGVDGAGQHTCGQSAAARVGATQ